MKLLFIGAHVDDIELACGGTVAKAVAGGHQVKMLVVSDSAGANYSGQVTRTREQALAEGINAARILGVTDIEDLGFPDKDVPYSAAVVEAVEACLHEFQPDLIFTHWPFDTHQDHKNVSQATISAARNANSILMFEPLAPSGRSYIPFRPQVYIDITNFVDRKLAALHAHESQLQKYGNCWLEAVEARARHHGYEMKTAYAETFEVLRFELKI